MKQPRTPFRGNNKPAVCGESTGSRFFVSPTSGIFPEICCSHIPEQRSGIHFVMSKHLQIVPGKQAEKTLSKEQKRFNSLVKKIETLRLEIEETKALDLELRRVGEARVTPAEKAAMAACRDWVMVLHTIALFATI